MRWEDVGASRVLPCGGVFGQARWEAGSFKLLGRTPPKRKFVLLIPAAEQHPQTRWSLLIPCRLRLRLAPSVCLCMKSPHLTLAHGHLNETMTVIGRRSIHVGCIRQSAY